MTTLTCFNRHFRQQHSRLEDAIADLFHIVSLGALRIEISKVKRNSAYIDTISKPFDELRTGRPEARRLSPDFRYVRKDKDAHVFQSRSKRQERGLEGPSQRRRDNANDLVHPRALFSERFALLFPSITQRWIPPPPITFDNVVHGFSMTKNVNSSRSHIV
ncbi:hypothetical protein Hte_003691 [Hypoxylon texense]